MRKYWLWFTIGGSVLIILIILLIILLLLIKNKNTTLKALQSCLTGVKVTKDMTSLLVPSNQCNDISLQTMDFAIFTKLKSLEIGSRSFENVVNLKIEGLSFLEKIVVNDNCFTKEIGSLSVKDCGALTAISIGIGSFVSFSKVVIESTPHLNQLVLSGNNFNNAASVNIVGLNSLQSVDIGSDSFLLKEGSFTLTDCSSLSSLKIGSHSFAKYSSFSLENVPSLGSLEIGSLTDSSSFSSASLVLKGNSTRTV